MAMNIPKMPKQNSKTESRLPYHNPKQELFDLKKSWKDLPLSAVESEYNYVHHSRRLHEVMGSKKGCVIDNKTPRTLRNPPPFAREKRPQSAGPLRRRKDKRPPTPSKTRPGTRDGRKEIGRLEDEEVSEECKQILKGGYTLDDDQKKVYDQFTEMLSDFDLRVAPRARSLRGARPAMPAAAPQVHDGQHPRGLAAGRPGEDGPLRLQLGGRLRGIRNVRRRRPRGFRISSALARAHQC